MITAHRRQSDHLEFNMAARKPEAVIIPLAYNLETRFQNGIRGFRPWRSRSDDRRTSPTNGSSRIQHGGTKTGSSNNSACIQLRNAILKRNQGFSTMASTFCASSHIADNRSSRIQHGGTKPEVVITSLTYNIETRFKI